MQTIIQDVGHYAYCGLNLSKSCVVFTFEFLISAHPNPKPTTLGIPLGGQPDKTRQLPFQEGRPLAPSDDKDEGQVVRSAKRFAPN
jgi:hypothetical protein